MHLHPALAPIKAAVLPLSKKLDEGATAVYEQLSKKFNCEYDNAGSIGKRYRRQDEIGTPYCITYDFDSAEDNSRLQSVTEIQWNSRELRLTNLKSSWKEN